MRRTTLHSLLVFLLLSLLPAVADDYQFLGDYRSHKKTADGIRIETSNKSLTVQVFEGMLRVQLEGPAAQESEFSPPSPQNFSVEESKESLQLSFEGGTVEFSKSPLRMTIRRSDGSVVCADDPSFGHGWDGKEVRVWKQLADDHRFFGLGEKSGDVDRRGRFFTNWNSDIPAYRNDTDPLYCGIPFFSGMTQGKAFGIFFANSYRSTFNLGAGNKRLFSFGAEDGPLVYYVFLGPDMKSVLRNYSALTGPMGLPPKWALGYQQCRWSYYPEYEVRDLAKEFRQRKIPVDVLYFDIHYMDAYKVFTWHPERFPRPQELLGDLQEEGFKTVTIIDPGVKVEPGYSVYDEGLVSDYFLKYLDGELFSGQVWPGWCHFPDFRKSGTREWWGKKNADLRQMGVSGFWNDMNEPALWGKEMPFVVEGIKRLHNRYALLMAKATYEGLLQADPDRRPFIVTRAGWAGIQKYSAVWTGDNSASYDDLSLSIRTNLGLGLSGVPFVGCDIGGFIGSPDPELYTRWMQAASLSPFMRSHTVHDSPDQEPWSYGEETERRCREAIERRYRLLPLLYSELYNSHQTGLPMYRPLWLEFPQDKMCFSSEFQHQFLIGEQLLAAPVLRKGQRFQKVYLPGGDWYEPSTGTLHQGGQSVLVEADLDTLPLFYRSGSIIPSRATQQFVDEKPLDELELTIVPGSSGHCRVVLDDGLSLDGATQFLYFTRTGDRELKIRFEGESASAPRTFKLRFVGIDDAQPSFSGGPVTGHQSIYRVPSTDGVMKW